MIEQSKTVCLVAAFCLIGASCFVSPVWGVGEGDQESLDLVMDALKSGDEDMMAVAIALVRDIEGADVTKALAKELPNLPATGKIQLLSALADRGDKAALGAAVEATKSDDVDVRIAAYKAVGQLGDASSVELLAGAGATQRGAEQKAARESLYRLRGEGIDEAVLKCIASAQTGVKIELIQTIGERNILSGVAALVAAAGDADTKVQRESFKTLKIVGSQKDLPGLIGLLMAVKSTSVRDEAVRTIAVIAKRNENEKEQAAVVLAAIDKADGVVNRSSLLSVLGKIGNDAGLDVLKKSLSDEDDKIRETAIRSLSDWPSGEPVTELLKVAVVSENPLHKILALRGYVRLLGLATDLPAKWTVAFYELGMELAPNVSEKKRVLSGLGTAGSAEALEAVKRYLDDEAVQTEAQVAAVKIAASVLGSHPEKARAVLERIAKEAKIETIADQAKQALNPADQDGDENQ